MKPELTKEQMQQIIAVLQSKVDAVESEKSEESEEIAKLKWHPKGGDYYVDSDGTFSYEGPHGSIEKTREFGCEFDAEEAVVKAIKAYRKYHRLYKLAEELNPPGWQPDFNDGSNFVITYYPTTNIYGAELIPSRDYLGAVYFDSYQTAREAIKILEQED